MRIKKNIRIFEIKVRNIADGASPLILTVSQAAFVTAEMKSAKRKIILNAKYHEILSKARTQKILFELQQVTVKGEQKKVLETLIKNENYQGIHHGSHSVKAGGEADFDVTFPISFPIY